MKYRAAIHHPIGFCLVLLHLYYIWADRREREMKGVKSMDPVVMP
jgi:hypothetical protein